MRAIHAAAFLLLLAAAPAAGQAVDAPDSASVAAALLEVCPGAHVRLYRDTGRLVQGRCGPVLDGRLLVGDRPGDERDVRLREVRQVWVHERQTRDGALVGAGIGAGTLMLAGALLTSMLCESSDCSGDYLIVIQYGTLVGGGAGALLGGAIGYLTRDWERRYP